MKALQLALCAAFILSLSEAAGGGCVSVRLILELSLLPLCTDLAHCTALAKHVTAVFLNYQLCFEPCLKGSWFISDLFYELTKNVKELCIRP